MPNKSKPSAKGSSAPALDRPFDRAILDRARLLAAEYSVLIEPESDVVYFGRMLEMPGAMGDGRTPQACFEAVRDAATTAIATLLELGQAPPPPASDRRRREQVNIRLTADEKAILEAAARSRGYRGLSDFIRSTTLATVR